MPRTFVERIDPETPDPATLQRAAGALRSGGTVAFPTETVYGLGANALDETAVAKVFEAKGRPANNPLIVHVAEPRDVAAFAEWSEKAARLAERFWPGPLTLVLPKTSAVSDTVTAGGGTVAVRCPAHPVARGLMAAAGVPIAAPSANRSGELSPTRIEHVLKTLEGRIDLALDGGPCPAGIESTVVDVANWRLLRPGPVTVDMLSDMFGALDQTAQNPTEPLPSPGLLTRHYAPRTALEIVETEDEAEFLTRLYQTAGLSVARWSAAGAPESVAARLYAELHVMDDGRYDRIVAVLPPKGPDWQAVRDRLTRAAAEEV